VYLGEGAGRRWAFGLPKKEATALCIRPAGAIYYDSRYVEPGAEGQTMRIKPKAVVERLGYLVAGGALAGLAVPLATRGPASTRLDVQRLGWCSARGAEPRDTLTVMTLNLAHGRRDGFHQALQRRERIEQNLSEVAAELARVDPDVVALQEADGPSIWSGSFDHVRYLASTARFGNFVRGEHVKGLKLAYGTALLAQLPLDDAQSVTFAPSPPTFSKGFVVSTVGWPGRPDVVLDVVSVHLDFARRSVREAQVDALAGVLDRRGRPAIVMGDFNCELAAKNSPLQKLVDARRLTAYQPDAKGFATFPSFGSRLDWILVSRGLDFAGYRTLPATLSDHLGVVAELKLAARA